MSTLSVSNINGVTGFSGGIFDTLGTTANNANAQSIAAFGRANAVGGAVTTANNTAIASFAKANNALANATGTLAGTLTVTGNVTAANVSVTGSINAAAVLVNGTALASGVTSLTAGNGITVSGSTGAVTVSQDIYTGSTANYTSYPIGTCVFMGYWDIANYDQQNLNSSVTVYVTNTASAKDFSPVSTSRVALTGTWRWRGSTTGYNGVNPSGVCQRTA